VDAVNSIICDVIYKSCDPTRDTLKTGQRWVSDGINSALITLAMIYRAGKFN
jgi:hypothetical protein